ncbi:MAG TPA: filamentous hemagglutinin N-terminal domain-containing protein, partial [Vicinamibacterales bacterium]|nr:filamentous hemagglutinin N-terminal domain-containing protein [Vicinamibacterales bacterium]
MNRPLPRHVSSSTAARAAPVLRLNPFAAAVRSSVLALACTALPAVAQLPTGNTTVVGTAGVTVNGDTMSINQGSDFAQIDWTTFNVGGNQAVEITQQANDFLLNQVVGGGGASQIDGRISGPGNTATLGQVAIINQAGVLIGSTGVINVGGLIAGSLAITGIAVEGGNGQGQETDGSQGPGTITLGPGTATNSVSIATGADITAGTGGVLLIGRTVSNAGDITSSGPVQLLGANGAVIAVEEAANQNTTMRAPPTVDSDSLVERTATGGGNAVANSGTITAPVIRLEAKVAPGLLNVVNNSGTLSATAIETDANGTVRLVGVGGGVQTGSVTAQGDGAGVGTITASATDASGTNGNVTVGDLDTGSTGSITIDASHQILDDGDAAAADATTETLTATAGTGIDLQTSVDDLTASVTGTGDLIVDEIGSGITLTSVQTAAGDLSVSAEGDIAATSVAATGGSATLQSTTAAGNIAATSVSGSGVTLIADAMDISGTVNAGTGVALLRPTTAATAISLGSEVANELSLTGTELDNITAGQITVGSTSSGALTVNTSIAPSNANTLNLVSGTQVTTAVGATVTETTLTASAGTGVDLDTDVATLDASVTGTGAITIDEADGLLLRDVTAGNGSITVTTAAGNITAGNVTATGNTVSLSATAGSIVDDGDSSGVTSIEADTVNLTVVDDGAIGANTGTGSVPADYLDLAGTPTIAVTGNAASAHVQFVTTSTVTSTQTGGLVAAGRDLGIAVSDGDFSFDDTAYTALGDGNLEVVANSVALDLDAPAQQEISTTGNVLLRARTGAITDAGDSLTALDITANGLTLDAVSGISADTEIATLDASIAGTGASGTLSINEANGITLTDVDHSNGDITITAAGLITATDVAATGGNVTLTATGADNGISTTTVSGNTVSLTAPGAIIGSGVSATDLVLSAGSVALGTDVDTLTATASSGTLAITEADAITLTQVQNTNGDVSVTAGGAITTTNVAATGVTLNAAGAVTGTGVSATNLDVTGTSIDLGTSVQNLNASASSGTLKITEASGVTLTDVDNANGAIDITAAGPITATDVAATGGNVTLTATGAGNGIATTAVSGPTVTLTAPGAITGTGVSATNLVLNGGSISLGTSVDTLTANASSGDLSITESNGITLSNVTTSANGNISVTANDGNIVAGVVNAGTGNVTLDADQLGTQQIRDDASGTLDTTTRIIGSTITLRAGGGIGSATENIDINGTSLVAQTNGGALNINEADAITLTTVQNNGGGDLALSTGANLTVSQTLIGNTVTLASGGAIIDENVIGPDVQATTL